MRVTPEQAQEVNSAWNKQRNDELYNNHNKEKCTSCGYIKGGTACRKKCDGEKGGRYSWLFALIALVIAYYYLTHKNEKHHNHNHSTSERVISFESADLLHF